jgi:hypothetical protein
MAERRAAFARFTAARSHAARPARGAVFASMRGPGDVSPLAARVFGIGR